MLKRFSVLTLLSLPLCGCVAVAVGGAAALITSEFADNAKVAYIPSSNAEAVWASVKLTLSEMASEPIELRNDLRAARARIDAASVTVQVETHSVTEVKLSVAARKVTYVGEIADLVIHRIKEDMRGATPIPE